MEITNPVIREYLASVMPERPSELESIHEYAMAHNVPIVKHEMEQFLKFIVSLHQPLRILEIGTAIGYSSILMKLAAPESARIITLERSEKMVGLARKNIEVMGLSHCIQVLEGDALETIKTIEGPMDLIFMDAAKGQYMNFYEDALSLLKPGGILVADNILQDGLIAKSRFAIPRRQRTIHQRMRQFISTLSSNPDLTTSVLPIADGATISVKHKMSN